MANDPELGKRVHEMLVKAGKETPLNVGRDDQYTEGPSTQEMISSHVYEIMSLLELDMKDDSLRDTPKRVAKMYCEEVFEGLNYDNFPKCTTTENKFGYDEIVLVRNNIVRSTCEHHLQPIYGRASIAYIPKQKVLGLSKFARVVDFFASRPQVQERFTEQVYAALAYILETPNIAVVVEASHFCMRMRGVEEHCSDTVTSKMGGKFLSVPALRAETMSLITESKPSW